jgi:predicted Zn-dependent peptidase
VRIDWTCDPAQPDALVKRVFQEVEFLRSNLLTRERVATIRQNLLRELDQHRQDNGFLLGQVARSYEDGDGAADVAATPVEIGALTGEAIQRAARTYLDTSRYVKVTLMPEGK